MFLFDCQLPTSDFLAPIALILLAIQIPATAILLSRLLRGPGRRSPLQPRLAEPQQLGTVSVVVPTLNEAERLGPCLAGLTQQGYEVREILIVDSYSTDGTPELVKAAGERDPRIRLLNDPPLPKDWVGRPWALHNGYLRSHPESTWVLGIDADTKPSPYLAASVAAAAATAAYDLVSLSPRFILQSLGEWWLQPALLLTLVYRFGPAGAEERPERVMANGQCFLVRRAWLDRLGGYECAKGSFCDDVTLARFAAAQGARVGFWDGANLIQVRMYEGMAETWREWGRSLDLKNASTPAQVLGDALFLFCVQALPLPCLLGLGLGLGLAHGAGAASLTSELALGLNAGLCVMRLALLGAIAPSYTWSKAGWAASGFWLSPVADGLAVLRIFLSSVRTPKQWRGRSY